VFLLSNVAATGAMSIGIVEGTNNSVLYDNAANSAGTYNNTGTNCILLLTAASQAATASLTSMDADGFTITWAKSGTPTGTATVRFLALQ
jgi:homoserine acetyltransferase